jgi:hypothetical protein
VRRAIYHPLRTIPGVLKTEINVFWGIIASVLAISVGKLIDTSLNLDFMDSVASRSGLLTTIVADLSADGKLCLNEARAAP